MNQDIQRNRRIIYHVEPLNNTIKNLVIQIEKVNYIIQ